MNTENCDAKCGLRHVVRRFASPAMLDSVATRTCHANETLVITISAQGACQYGGEKRYWKLLGIETKSLKYNLSRN